MSNDNKMFGRGEKIFFITSILLFGMIVATAAVARIRENISMPAKKEMPIAKTVTLPAKVAAAKIKAPKKHYSLSAKEKTINDIARENELKERQEVANLQISRTQVTSMTSSVAKLKDNDAAPKAEQQRKDPDMAKVQGERDRKQAELDRVQAEKDRAQADLDRLQAEKDRAQAERDREQAVRDREQAEKDRAQSEKDRAQAEHERQQNAVKTHANVQE